MPNKYGENKLWQASPNPREQFAESFGQWEQAGRGWQVFDYEIELEPAFSIFTARREIARPVDDGRIQSFWGRLFQTGQNENLISNQNDFTADKAENKQLRCRSAVKATTFQIYLPAELKLSSEQTEQLLLALAHSASFVGIEIFGNLKEIGLQIVCPEAGKSAVFAQLKSHLPEIDFRESEDALRKNLQRDRMNETVLVDFGLGNEWFIPLPTTKSFAADTFLPLVAAMEELSEEEILCLQVLFCRARGDWQKAAKEAIFDRAGKPVFANLQNYLPGIKEKLDQPFLAASVRLIAQSESREKSVQIVRCTGAFFRQFSSPAGNELMPLRNDGLNAENHFGSFLNRTSYRTGILLSARELAAIAHFPADSIKSAKLLRNKNLTKAAPEFALKGDLILGENSHAGQTRTITLGMNLRTKHMHLVGASGSGKSTLLSNMMIQDLDQGNGFACFDPHGDLIDAVLERVPEYRLRDVVLFDPADEQFPIGFNILSAHSELEKTLLASDLVSIFRRFSTSWGDVMNSILANAVLAFLDSERGGNLLDLKRFLIDKNFREDFLATVKDGEIRYYWLVEFPQLKGKPFAPLLTRLDTFLRSKLIRHIVSAKENKLDFRRMMDERKVLLVRLSLGSIGEENAYLLGSLLVSKLHQATLSRQNIAEEERQPFFLYLDEAHHFITNSMNHILSGVRKYKLGLVLAHQQLRQFQTGESDILSSVLANCYTRICFRLDDADAERLAKGFSFFTAEHLKNLGVGEAIVRLEQSRYDFNLKAFPLPPAPFEIAERRKSEIVRDTRERYAVPKEAVDAESQAGCETNLATRRIKEQRSLPEIPKAGEIQSTEQAANIGTGHVESQKSSLPTAKATKGEEPGGKTVEPPVQPSKTLVPAQIPSSPEKPSKTSNNRQHLYLQALVKRMAEARGFLATVEKEVFGGSGKIDVALEREDLRIAVEISVTTPPDYELNNIQKCLAAGYVPVTVLAERRHLDKIRQKAEETLDRAELEKVLFLEPDEFNSFLESIPAEKEREGRRVKGFRVNLKLKQSGKPEQNARQQVISEVVLKAMKRLKKDQS